MNFQDTKINIFEQAGTGRSKQAMQKKKERKRGGGGVTKKNKRAWRDKEERIRCAAVIRGVEEGLC